LKDPLELLREYLPPLPHELFGSKKRKREIRSGSSSSANVSTNTAVVAVEKVETCAECFDKHLGASHKLCREAYEWYEREDHSLTERIQKKFRSIREELAGMSDDIHPGAPKELEEVYNEAQRVRKRIWSIGLPQGLGGGPEDMAKICTKLKMLQDEVNEIARKYKIREAKEYEEFV